MAALESRTVFNTSLTKGFSNSSITSEQRWPSSTYEEDNNALECRLTMLLDAKILKRPAMGIKSDALSLS
jgi:hypothetical protein